MKKFIYILAFAVVSAMTVSACTEESIEPTQINNNGSNTGSTGNDPIKP